MGTLVLHFRIPIRQRCFFKQFDKKLTKLFDGVRHDSGDPVEFAQLTIDHYKSKGIDPRSKEIIFF